MKTKTLWMQFLALVFLLGIGSCTKEETEEKKLEPEQAKIELRNATQQINTDMDQMMNMPSMQSLNFLSTLMDAGWKSKMQKVLFQSGKLQLTKFKNAFRLDESGMKSTKAVGDYGIYTFNFLLEDFELTETSTTKLKLIFPSDEQAYTNQQNNGEFMMDNLQYTTITTTDTYWDEYSQSWVTETYEEVFPTNVDLSLKLNGSDQMTGSYHSEITEEGFPTSVAINFTSAPYQFQMGMSGSGVNYNSNLSFKKDNAEMMGYNWDLTYNSDMSDVEKLSGYYLVNPLKLEGFMNYAAINTYMSGIDENGGTWDLDYVNSQLSLALIQTGLNAKIGDVIYKLYTDPEYNDTYPNLAVVYSDGSYEWLSDIMAENDVKYSRLRK